MWRFGVILAACGEGAGGGPTVSITADVLRGPIPLEVRLEAAGDPPATQVTWSFDDGSEAEGEVVSHTFLAAGSHRATVTWATADGSASASVDVSVEAEQCPVSGIPAQRGEVVETGFQEVSGVAASRKNAGVLWFHEDKNNLNHLYATDESGAILADYDLDGALLDDLEDLAIGRNPETGNDRIYLGDIGDNDYLATPRDGIAVYLISEPTVVAGQSIARATLQIATSVLLAYPDTPHNAEALLVDPVTDDLFVITKELSGAATVFRKAAPHTDGEVAVLEAVGTVDLAQATAGDISPLGNQILLRTYGPSGLLWLRDGGESVADALSRAPCPVTLAPEPQSESAGFAADGSGIWTISEVAPEVWFSPLSPGG